MIRTLKFILITFILAFSTLSQASLITYNFAGTLTTSLGSLSSGDAFSGSYTVDTTIAATVPSTSSYAVFNNLTDVSIVIGAFSAVVGPGSGLPEIQQDDVAGADRYALLGRNPVGSSQISGLDIISIGFRLDDSTGGAISDALNLLTNPILSNFSSNELLLFFVGQDQQGQNRFEVVTGSLSSLSIPEPGTLALMGLGLAGIGYRRHRSRITKQN